MAERLRSALERLGDVASGGAADACECTAAVEDRTLALDARECEGRPATSAACRATAARAVAAADVERMRVRTAGADRFYDEPAVDLLGAAARFADLLAEEAPVLAEEALRDPVSAARAAAARAAPVDAVAADTGLLEAASRVDAPFDPQVAPAVADARIDPARPPTDRLREARELATGATVRVYDDPDRGTALYHLEPVEATLPEHAFETLAAARSLLAGGDAAAHDCAADWAGTAEAPGSGRSDSLATATGDLDGATLTPVRAIRAIADGNGTGGSDADEIGARRDHADGSDPGGDDADRARAGRNAARSSDAGGSDAGATDVRTLARVLRKHTTGYGVLEDCFADPAVSDVYASGPAAETPLRVVADGELARTNVTLTPAGVGALASRLRRASGSSFSRAAPTVDATVRVAGERVRAAGVHEPATAGRAFAFRAGAERAFTLPALVANGTLPPAAAGLLSVAVRRSAAVLVAGPRGAGKTTLLGALLWELPATRRVVVVEDTPELPVAALQEHGRDAQPLRTTLRDGPGVEPAAALRTALRLGESALVVGEVRGEEAATLFEAMRVGAGGEAVLGTLHGERGAGVRERVVAELGVSPASFAATDLVVTCERAPDGRSPATAGVDPSAAGDGPPSAGGIPTGGGDRAPGVEPVGDGGARTTAADGGVAHGLGPAVERPSAGGRRLAAIEECRDGDGRFASLFEREGTGRETTTLASTGRAERGNSDLLHDLAAPGETYAEVLAAVRRRATLLDRLAARGTTEPAPVTSAYARYGGESC